MEADLGDEVLKLAVIACEDSLKSYCDGMFLLKARPKEETITDLISCSVARENVDNDANLIILQTRSQESKSGADFILSILSAAEKIENFHYQAKFLQESSLKQDSEFWNAIIYNSCQQYNALVKSKNPRYIFFCHNKDGKTLQIRTVRADEDIITKAIDLYSFSGSRKKGLHMKSQADQDKFNADASIAKTKYESAILDKDFCDDDFSLLLHEINLVY